jgi:NhaP-type Na+/H+ or K+/H+ antiporter
VLVFGLFLNNFKLLQYPIVRKFLSFDRLTEVTKEMKLMTAETAFIIRTFFFLLFGYSIDLISLKSWEVVIIGFTIICVIILFRLFFLRFFLKITSAPLTLIAPRGLITILLYYSIPEQQRIENLSEGVLFLVIVFTGIMMTIGLMLHRETPEESFEKII